ncbi:hypothetical protein Tco_0151879 [Tanacetum coccineum]
MFPCNAHDQAIPFHSLVIHFMVLFVSRVYEVWARTNERELLILNQVRDAPFSEKKVAVVRLGLLSHAHAVVKSKGDETAPEKAKEGIKGTMKWAKEKTKKGTKQQSEHGNARKKDGFWGEVLVYIVTKRKRTAESGAGDEDYVQRAMIHYQAETGLPFKFRHCWDVLKDSLKWKEIALLNFNTGFEGGSKRHKSSGSSSFNTESEDASINLNTNVVDEDEVYGNRDDTTKYRQQQEDIRFYLQAYDHLTGDQRMAIDEARAKIKAKYNLQY